ncbi:hypothetical protein BQ8794_30173 [Mesorhizobium prunaredense]|uniref:Uncharacterized protein n=1 Tax=Mesorhizobium prunaredense TaxID=1631249 RepID=A0A1R3VBS2_9HYPH|nr:hypothetical protein BQ8794_30173 [Mesorhizobium prunaredense]
MALHDLVQKSFWDHAGWTAFRRVASKGVYAGGGSIAEGGAGCKPKAAIALMSGLGPGADIVTSKALKQPTGGQPVHSIGEHRRDGAFGRARR